MSIKGFFFIVSTIMFALSAFRASKGETRWAVLDMIGGMTMLALSLGININSP